MKNEKVDVIKMLRNERVFLQEKTIYSYKVLCLSIFILLVDLMIIIFVRAITLNFIAWAGIFFCFVLCAVAGKQHIDYRTRRDNIDRWYVRSQYNFNKRKEKRMMEYED